MNRNALWLLLAIAVSGVLLGDWPWNERGLAFGALPIAWPKNEPDPEGPPGWDDIILCSELTSIDSKASLSLSEDNSVELQDTSDEEDHPKIKGKWSLLDTQKHIYKIDVSGEASEYTVVSPPDGEGCILAAGTSTDQVNLRRSWYSTPPDSEESN